MKKIITYIFLFSVTLLFGCNSSTTNDNASAGSADVVDSAGNADNNTASRPSVLEGMVGEADFVFAGTLKSIDFRTSAQGIPSTFATYEVDDVIKGSYDGKTYTISFLGGFFSEAQEKHLTVSNSPKVDVGEYAILMVQQGEDTGCALVKCYHGKYTVKDGEVIAPNDSTVVINKTGLKFISEAAKHSGIHKAALDAMNVETFISHLKSIASDSKFKGKGEKIIVDVDMNVPFDSPAHLFQGSSAPAINSAAKSAPKSNQGSAFDQWEEQQVANNGGNPVLTQAYYGE